jgi:hypothetical protein
MIYYYKMHDISDTHDTHDYVEYVYNDTFTFTQMYVRSLFFFMFSSIFHRICPCICPYKRYKLNDSFYVSEI